MGFNPQSNLVPGRGPVAGDLLARHAGVDQITFTGSVATGQKVLAAAIESLETETVVYVE